MKYFQRCEILLPGPAMQDEALRLILLALEDGSELSRKVLVMFVVNKLQKQFSQASKTSVGHVVQLLYRASCFVVRQIICYSSNNAIVCVQFSRICSH